MAMPPNADSWSANSWPPKLATARFARGLDVAGLDDPEFRL